MILWGWNYHKTSLTRRRWPIVRPVEISFKRNPPTGYAWTLTVPGWLVFRNERGSIVALRVPYPWERFGVPDGKNHYRYLTRPLPQRKIVA